MRPKAFRCGSKKEAPKRTLASGGVYSFSADTQNTVSSRKNGNQPDRHTARTASVPKMPGRGTARHPASVPRKPRASSATRTNEQSNPAASSIV